MRVPPATFVPDTQDGESVQVAVCNLEYVMRRCPVSILEHKMIPDAWDGDSSAGRE